MSIDVVTNVVSGVLSPKNATTVVYCPNTGEYSSTSGIYETSISFTDLENRYTGRFYNGIFTETIGG